LYEDLRFEWQKNTKEHQSQAFSVQFICNKGSGSALAFIQFTTQNRTQRCQILYAKITFVPEIVKTEFHFGLMQIILKVSCSRRAKFKAKIR